MIEALIVFSIVFLIFSLLVSAFRSPLRKGKDGEKVVAKMANKYLDSDNYKLLNNVTLETRGGTTQIDHVIISRHGVFVIETKNMSGWIFGGERQRQWTQTFSSGDKYKMQNPLHQNYKHVRAVQTALRLQSTHMHNIVCFSGASEFRTLMPSNVTQGNKLIQYIRSVTTEVFTQEQVDNMVNTLETLRLEDSKETDTRHIENLSR